MKVYFSSGLMLLALQLVGCNVDVQQTETGVTIAIECGDSPSDEQPTDEEPAVDDPADPGTDEPSPDEPATDDGTNAPLLENG